jgi:hypothetical protein
VETVDSGPLGLIAAIAFPVAVAVGIGAVWAGRSGRAQLMWLCIAVVVLAPAAFVDRIEAMARADARFRRARGQVNRVCLADINQRHGPSAPISPDR